MIANIVDKDIVFHIQCPKNMGVVMMLVKRLNLNFNLNINITTCKEKIMFN